MKKVPGAALNSIILAKWVTIVKSLAVLQQTFTYVSLDFTANGQQRPLSIWNKISASQGISVQLELQQSKYKYWMRTANEQFSLMRMGAVRVLDKFLPQN